MATGPTPTWRILSAGMLVVIPLLTGLSASSASPSETDSEPPVVWLGPRAETQHRQKGRLTSYCWSTGVVGETTRCEDRSLGFPSTPPWMAPRQLRLSIASHLPPDRVSMGYWHHGDFNKVHLQPFTLSVTSGRTSWQADFNLEGDLARLPRFLASASWNRPQSCMGCRNEASWTFQLRTGQ